MEQWPQVTGEQLKRDVKRVKDELKRKYSENQDNFHVQRVLLYMSS